MSIAALTRITVYGLASEKERVLEGLQALGCLHLIDLRPEAEPSGDPTAADLREGYDALRHLESSPRRWRTGVQEAPAPMPDLVEQAIGNRRQLRDTRDRIDDLRQAIGEVEPWGDFTIPPSEALGGRSLWFFVVPLRDLAQLEEAEHPWQVVNRDHRHAYVVVIGDAAAPPESMPGRQADLIDVPLSDLRRALEVAVAREHDLQAERWRLTRGIDQLRHDLTRAENRAVREAAAAQTFDTDAVFAVRGWVPEDRLQDLRTFTERNGLACTYADPDPTDTPPILLSNQEPIAAGEDLIAFFQLPGYRDWDPSATVFLSFTLFFAIIVSDAGYAACLGIVLLLLWRRLGKTGQSLRWRRLCLALVGASVGYGALVGSYFGVAPPPGSFLATLHLLDLNDFDGMMLLTIGVGAAHVALANGVVAWHRRRSWTALASIGWILVISGGMTFLVSRSVPAIPPALGPWLLGAGGLAILAFSSERRIQRPGDLLGRALDGLKAATGITTAVGDVLSYLRLFALGLASASLAITFNGLALQTIEALPAIGLLFGIVILLLGHVLNLVLVVIGGVVHGLRLNLIEFYRWSIHDEGRPFTAFRNKETIPWTH